MLRETAGAYVYFQPYGLSVTVSIGQSRVARRSRRLFMRDMRESQRQVLEDGTLLPRRTKSDIRKADVCLRLSPDSTARRPADILQTFRPGACGSDLH